MLAAACLRAVERREGQHEVTGRPTTWPEQVEDPRRPPQTPADPADASHTLWKTDKCKHMLSKHFHPIVLMLGCYFPVCLI